MTVPALTAATSARYAAQAFAEIATANQTTITPENAQALAGEIRELLLSTQQALRIIQGNVPAAAAGELQEAKHATGHAARSIERAYSPTPGPTAAEDGYTPVTGADEIKAMPHGTELVVEGTVYRVSRMTGCQTYVRNLQGTAFTPPTQFIEVFAGTPIYRRH